MREKKRSERTRAQARGGNAPKQMEGRPIVCELTMSNGDTLTLLPCTAAANAAAVVLPAVPKTELALDKLGPAPPSDIVVAESLLALTMSERSKVSTSGSAHSTVRQALILRLLAGSAAGATAA